MGRVLALCGWLAWQVRRPFGTAVGRRWGRVPAQVLAGMLLLGAAVPIVAPLLDAQPLDTNVSAIFDGEVSAAGTWVRIEGRAFPLRAWDPEAPRDLALLVDAERRVRAIVVRAPEAFPSLDPIAVPVRPYSGRLASEAVPVDVESLPIEATEAGTPPRVVPDRIIELDAVAKPERSMPWPLAIPPALLATVLLAGARAGYPVFREATEVDVLVSPLGVGERLPAAWGGRIGPTTSSLSDPAAALLLVRRAPSGNQLVAQPLVDAGPAPQPVPIGGSWTAGRIGYVHTVRETVPALAIRSELVDATFLFARTSERDRVAALVTLSR